MEENLEPIYVELASESDNPKVTIIDSLCVSCHNTGTTRLLMTRIPHFKEVILTSFQCEHCGNRNTGFQPGQMQELGVRYELTVKDIKDLSRQVVRSDQAIVSIPEVQLDIPGDGERGEVTTVEGLVKRTVEGLSQDQSARRLQHPEVAEQIENFISQLHDLLTLKESFTVIVDDPSGNSFVENPSTPQADPLLKRSTYKRTPEQNTVLGLDNNSESQENGCSSISEESESYTEKKDDSSESEKKEEEDTSESIKDEVLVFSTLCDKCSRPADTKMKVVQIPYFKEVIIMATDCEACGNRTNEVKSGSGISEKGRRITLNLTDPCDMARDVLKSETCALIIPELDLDVGGGVIGGKFTTLEGLLNDVKENLQNNPFLMGDSSDDNRKEVTQNLLNNIDKVIDGTLHTAVVLDDPAGNSYLQNIYAPDDDPEMTVEEYERTFEQNEDLGLNDMKTENYTDDSLDNDLEIESP